MIVSDTLDYADLYRELEIVSAKLGRQVQPTIYSNDELRRRIESKNAFVTKVLGGPKVWVIGRESDFAVR